MYERASLHDGSSSHILLACLWARRPLVAARAAILASLLPADADRERFMHALGIHGDPVAAKQRIELAKKSGENLGLNPYGYGRAFSYTPTSNEKEWLNFEARRIGIYEPSLLDPTAGGGSIPFEAVRLGLKNFSTPLLPWSKKRRLNCLYTEQTSYKSLIVLEKPLLQKRSPCTMAFFPKRLLIRKFLATSSPALSAAPIAAA